MTWHRYVLVIMCFSHSFITVYFTPDFSKGQVAPPFFSPANVHRFIDKVIPFDIWGKKNAAVKTFIENKFYFSLAGRRNREARDNSNIYIFLDVR